MNVPSTHSTPPVTVNEFATLPPGYKRTDVGVIPEDWQVDTLTSVTPRRVDHAIVDGPFGSNLKRIHYRASGVPIITSGYVTEGIFQAAEYLYVEKNKFQQEKRSAVSPGDIVMAKIGARCGACAILPDGHPIGILSGNALKITVDTSRHSTYFIWQLLWSRYATRSIEAWKSIGAQPAISMPSLKKQLFPLPLLREQCAISEALSDVDGLLGALEALIVKKRAIKHGVMQQLLTGKIRLPDFREEWKRVVLGDHVTFLKTGINSRAELTNDGPVKYLHYGDIHTSNRVRLDPLATSMPSLPEEHARTLDRLRDGDLVLVDASEDLNGVGKSVEICGLSGAEIVAGLHTIAARFDKSVVADGFKAYLQFCPAFRDQLRRLAAGTKVFATNRTHISSVEMRLPSTREQTAIATLLSDMDAEIAALELWRHKTRGTKQGMMQQLLTGRVRLVRPAPTETGA
jgi:type I restriction enzyme, S subunit